MTKVMIRPPQVTTSSGRVGSTTASNRPAPSVAPTTAVPRASDPVSRSAATSTSVAPISASAVGVKASCSRPPLTCTSARRHANPTASMTTRATRSAANARELDRRTPLPLGEDIVGYAVDGQVPAESGGDLAPPPQEDPGGGAPGGGPPAGPGPGRAGGGGDRGRAPPPGAPARGGD